MMNALKNAMIYDCGKMRALDASVDEKILALMTDAMGDGDCAFDNIAVLPGFCDVHVHFREPGFSYKETIRTGSLAAARGGYKIGRAHV